MPGNEAAAAYDKSFAAGGDAAVIELRVIDLVATPKSVGRRKKVFVSWVVSRSASIRAESNAVSTLAAQRSANDPRYHA